MAGTDAKKSRLSTDIGRSPGTGGDLTGDAAGLPSARDFELVTSQGASDLLGTSPKLVAIEFRSASSAASDKDGWISITVAWRSSARRATKSGVGARSTRVGSAVMVILARDP